MNRVDEIRKTVTESYTRAVSEPGSGCCGGTTTLHKGVAVRSAGYRPEELATLPEEAVVNAFGCGNPLAYSEVKEGEVVLDLGSGAGIDLLLAARRVGPSGRVLGVDMTDAMIEKARANIAATGVDNVEVRKGLIENLPVESNSVDWVISNCVINLSPEKPKVFREIARVLRPGGRMQVSDIVVESIPDWVRDDAVLYSACVAGAISEAEYVAGLEAAGLVDVEVIERLVYDRAQLTALAESEIAQDVAEGCGCSVGSLLDKLVPALEGKVWSAKFAARKEGSIR